MHIEQTNPIASRAADAIVALINSRPASPTKAEIAAVIAGNTGLGSRPVSRDIAARREQWSRLAAEVEAACEISGNLLESTPEGAAADAVTQAAAARYKAFCAQLWAVPPAQADIALLAQLLYHECDFGGSLTASDADQRMEHGPASDGGTVHMAQAALLRAIREQYLCG